MFLWVNSRNLAFWVILIVISAQINVPSISPTLSPLMPVNLHSTDDYFYSDPTVIPTAKPSTPSMMPSFIPSSNAPTSKPTVIPLIKKPSIQTIPPTCIPTSKKATVSPSVISIDQEISAPSFESSLNPSYTSSYSSLEIPSCRPSYSLDSVNTTMPPTSTQSPSFINDSTSSGSTANIFMNHLNMIVIAGSIIAVLLLLCCIFRFLCLRYTEKSDAVFKGQQQQQSLGDEHSEKKSATAKQMSGGSHTSGASHYGLPCAEIVPFNINSNYNAYDDGEDDQQQHYQLKHDIYNIDIDLNEVLAATATHGYNNDNADEQSVNSNHSGAGSAASGGSPRMIRFVLQAPIKTVSQRPSSQHQKTLQNNESSSSSSPCSSSLQVPPLPPNNLKRVNTMSMSSLPTNTNSGNAVAATVNIACSDSSLPKRPLSMPSSASCTMQAQQQEQQHQLTKHLSYSRTNHHHSQNLSHYSMNQLRMQSTQQPPESLPSHHCRYSKVATDHLNHVSSNMSYYMKNNRIGKSNSDTKNGPKISPDGQFVLGNWSNNEYYDPDSNDCDYTNHHQDSKACDDFSNINIDGDNGSVHSYKSNGRKECSYNIHVIGNEGNSTHEDANRLQRSYSYHTEGDSDVTSLRNTPSSLHTKVQNNNNHNNNNNNLQTISSANQSSRPRIITQNPPPPPTPPSRTLLRSISSHSNLSKLSRSVLPPSPQKPPPPPPIPSRSAKTTSNSSSGSVRCISTIPNTASSAIISAPSQNDSYYAKLTSKPSPPARLIPSPPMRVNTTNNSSDNNSNNEHIDFENHWSGRDSSTNPTHEINNTTTTNDDDDDDDGGDDEGVEIESYTAFYSPRTHRILSQKDDYDSDNN